MKRKYILGIFVVFVLVLIISVSYAIWQINLKQESTNTISTGCFKIEFEDENPINLGSAYPTSDEDVSNLIPYTFTITNTCDSYATYQINLEVLNTTTLERLEYISLSLNEKEKKSFSSFEEVSKTLEDATASRKLEDGYLDKKESKTFELRVWLDENTPAIEGVMNKTWISKITIATSYLPESPSYAEVITNCSRNGYNTTECMLENSKYDTVNLAYDETVDNNLRYIGSNPNNYVTFNNELWRIIGVMNNVENGNGKVETRLKIIREESIGKYFWDSSSSSVNGGSGINEWSQADANIILNDYYYESKDNQRCYIGKNNATTDCHFGNIGLSENTKSMIEEVVWNVGANGKNIAYDRILSNTFYELERGNGTGKICSSGNSCNDNIKRTTKWIGNIGLIYPSDYGMAVGGNYRDDCLNNYLSNWNDERCYNNDWLHNFEVNLWTITPSSRSDSAHYAFRILMDGRVIGGGNVDLSTELFPTLYLKSNIQIISGEGTSTNPYKLEMVGV